MEGTIKNINGVETLVVNRVIDAVDFKKYELWLEDKEATGWNLKRIEYSNDHIFEKGEKRKIRYCLGEDKALNKEYKNMFEDFGWSLVHEVGNNYIWMMEYEGERPEEYNDIEDIESRNKKYRKRIGVTGFAAIIYLAYVVTTVVKYDFNPLWIIFGLLCVALYFYINLRPQVPFLRAYKKNSEVIKAYRLR